MCPEISVRLPPRAFKWSQKGTSGSKCAAWSETTGKKKNKGTKWVSESYELGDSTESSSPHFLQGLGWLWFQPGYHTPAAIRWPMQPHDINSGAPAPFLLNRNAHHKTATNPRHLARHLPRGEATGRDLTHAAAQTDSGLVAFHFQVTSQACRSCTGSPRRILPAAPGAGPGAPAGEPGLGGAHRCRSILPARL